MPVNLLSILFGSIATVGILSLPFWWRYANRHNYYKLLWFIYAVTLTYLLSIAMAFDFSKMVFDVVRLNAFWDPPAIMSSIFLFFMLSRLCFGVSFFQAFSETLSSKATSAYAWWHFLASFFVSNLIFSLLELMSLNIPSSKSNLQLLLTFTLPSLFAFLFLQPLPWIQKRKNRELDPWGS